jgi:hypothetical protein
MAAPVADLQSRQRRRNAAALQAYLRQRDAEGLPMSLGDLQVTARDMGDELCGRLDLAHLVRQARVNLILMGLLIADPRPAGGVTWRLTDVPQVSRRPGGARPSSEGQR